jgi:hypothetical protein
MRAQSCNCTDEYRPDLSGSFSDHPRIAWRNALTALARPMLRLHQLRNIRTQMLRDALNNRDCNNHRAQDA